MTARRAAAAIFLVGAGVCCTSRPAGAQGDTVQVADSLPPRAPRAPHPLPVEEAEVPTGPLAPGTRLTLTRDSILWTSAFTLADLLGTIPGVYIARAGFLGQPEYVQYGGRGGAALEVYWDGVPYEPLGTDSLFVDPGRIPLSYLRRIDIEILPAALRVYLVSERHELLRPRSKVRVVSGPFETAAYGGLFQHRWGSGLGLDLAADFLGTEGASGPGRSDQFFDVWLKASWTPTPASGASYQLRRQRQDRAAVKADGALAVPALHGARTDFQFSLFSMSAPYGQGLRAEGGVAASRWDPDSASSVPPQQIRQAFAGLRYGRRNVAVGVTGRLADRRTTAALTGRFGWVPFDGVVVAGDARWQRHEGDRISRTAHGSVGVYRGPLSLVGELSLGRAVQGPALLGDTAISTTDRALRAGLTTGVLDGSIAVVRRSEFAPLPYPDLGVLSGLARTPPLTYLVAALQFRPSTALSLGAWYSDPLGEATADLQPPTHARADITLRSKFWRTFRSGAFDVMVQLAMESWSTGMAGSDARGSRITLPGATFYHLFVQFQVVDFALFWDYRNARLTTASYVPGLPYPRQAQTFGVSWEFFN